MLVKAPLAWRGVTWGDAIEIAGVYAVLSLYAAIRSTTGAASSGGSGARAAIFGFAAISYALGHGIHVAANSAHDMLAATGGLDPWGLVALWDEGIGHYLVDAGRVAFAIGLTWAEANDRGTGTDVRARWLLAFGATAYGFIYFATGVEGQTAPLALPFCAAYVAWAARSARRVDSLLGLGPRIAPIRWFFTIAAWTALLFFAIWAAMQHGRLPEFTKVGIL